MNIDLFLTTFGESGLLCDEILPEKVSGVILDAETNFLTLEFGESGETLHLNIPIVDTYKDKLLFSAKIQIGMLDGGMIADHIEVPLLYLNDPYGSDFGDALRTGRPMRSLLRFEQFMKRCTFAQAVHRVDVGDESTIGSVLHGANPHSLQFAPQLARVVQLESAPKSSNAYIISPNTLDMKGPGGSGSGVTRRIVTRQKPIKDSEDK